MINKIKLLVTVAAMSFVLASTALAGSSFDGDQNTDFLIATDMTYYGTIGEAAGKIEWHEFNTATQEVESREIQTYCSQTFTTLAMGNLDNDEHMDLVVAGSNVIRWYEAYDDNTATLIVEWNDSANHTDIKFCDNVAYVTHEGGVSKIFTIADNQAVKQAIISSATKTYLTLAACDFDADSNTELIVGWRDTNYDPNFAMPGQIDLYEESGSSIAWIRTMSYHAGGYEFVSGDLDGDQYTDIITSDASYRDTSWLEADGTDNGLVYRQRIQYRTVYHAIFADVDGDEYTDFLYSAINNGEITTWFEANGDNTLVSRGNLNNNHKSNCLAVGDWDRDGFNDVFYGSKLSTYGIQQSEATGDNVLAGIGAFSNYHYYVGEAIVTSPPQVCGDPGTVYPAADLNHDCHIDLQDFSILSSQWLGN